MTTAIRQFFLPSQLSPVRLLRDSNLSATYNNGASNNGVGATLTTASASLTIDSVACVNGDRVVLINQTNAYENGIYVVSGVGSVVVLTRSYDFQSFDQMIPGLFLSVAAGTVYNGAMYAVVEPQCQVVGTSDITFVDASASPNTVTLANNGLNIYNPAGTFLNHVLFDSAITADRNFTITTGDAARTITLSGNPTLADWFDQSVKTTASPAFVNIDAGASGAAGTVDIFPATAANGKMILAAVDNGGARNVTISNAAHGQSSVYSIPDGGQATAEFIISDSAGIQHITSGALGVDAGIVDSGLAAGGFAGQFRAYSNTASMGSFNLLAADNAGNFVVSIKNASHGQASAYVIPDAGVANGSLLSNALALADPNVNIIQFSVTCGQAALAAGGEVVLIDSSGAKQYRLLDLIINSGGTNFSGGGGDRLGQVTDGTTVYSVVPAASLQTLANARWGDTAMAFPASAAINTLSAAGADLVFKYSGGTTDYTAGSVVISGVAMRIA